MRMIHRISLHLAVAAAVMLACPAAAQAASMAGASTEKAVHLPPVQLEHWKNSPQGERYAFLIGLFSMMEMERAWQGKKELPVSHSINGTWVRGLSGKTLREISDAVDQYYLDHPEAGEKPVLEVIGRIYVKPVLTQDERDAAAARYTKVKAEWESR